MIDYKKVDKVCSLIRRALYGVEIYDYWHNPPQPVQILSMPVDLIYAKIDDLKIKTKKIPINKHLDLMKQHDIYRNLRKAIHHTCISINPQFTVFTKYRKRCIVEFRYMLIHMLYDKISHFTLQELGLLFNMDHASISAGKRRCDDLLQMDPLFKLAYNMLLPKIKFIVDMNVLELETYVENL